MYCSSPAFTASTASGDPFDPADVLAGLDVGVAYVARDWHVTYANAAWVELAGGWSGADAAGGPAAVPSGTLWEAFPALAASPEAARRIEAAYQEGAGRGASAAEMTAAMAAAGSAPGSAPGSTTLPGQCSAGGGQQAFIPLTDVTGERS